MFDGSNGFLCLSLISARIVAQFGLAMRYQGTIEYGLIVLLLGRLIMGYTPKKTLITGKMIIHHGILNTLVSDKIIFSVTINYQTWNMSTQYVYILLFNMCITYCHIVYKSISRISEQPTNGVCVYFWVCLEMRHSARGKKQNETEYIKIDEWIWILLWTNPQWHTKATF